MLEAWYALSEPIPERLESPRLVATWAALHPGSLLSERPDRSELARAEEWLAVARVLSRYDPGALRALGFDGDTHLLERLIIVLPRATAANEELRPLAESVLARI